METKVSLRDNYEFFLNRGATRAMEIAGIELSHGRLRGE